MNKREGYPIPPVAMATALIAQRLLFKMGQIKVGQASKSCHSMGEGHALEVQQTPTVRKVSIARQARGLAAVALGVGSGALLLGTLHSFVRRGTTLDPNLPSSALVLVTSGTNGLSRNPMYLGMAGLLLAHAVDRASLLALLPVAGFGIVLDRGQILREEQALRSRFGDEYLSYCASTPRWLDARSFRFLAGLVTLRGA